MFGRKALLMFLTNVVGAILGFASSIAMTKMMTEEAIGVLGYTLGLVGLGAFIADLGFDAAHVKRVSEGRDLGDSLATFGRIKTLLVGLFAFGAVTAAILIDRTLGFYDTTLTIVLVMVVYYVAFAMRKIPARTFDGLRRTAQTQASILVEHLLKAPLVIIVALMFGHAKGWDVPFSAVAEWGLAAIGFAGEITDQQGGLWLTLAHTIPMFASMAVGIWMLHHYRYPRGQFDTELAKDYIRFAVPIAFLVSITVIAQRIDMFMIGYFWGPADVGYYYAAKRLTSFVLMVPMAIGTLFFPLISELRSRGADEGVNEVARSTTRAISLVVTLLAMFLVVFAPNGIHVFMRDRFLPAAPVLVILAVHTYLVGFSTVAGNIIKGFDMPKLMSIIGGIAIASNIAFNAILIPDSIFGIPLFGLRAPGAALATALAQLLQLVMLIFMIKKLTGQVHMPVAVGKHLAAAVITGAILHFGETALLFGADRWYELIWAGIVGTALYAVVLVLLRELGRSDLRKFMDLVHPVEMWRYIRDELGSKGRKKHAPDDES